MTKSKIPPQGSSPPQHSNPGKSASPSLSQVYQAKEVPWLASHSSASGMDWPDAVNICLCVHHSNATKVLCESKDFFFFFCLTTISSVPGTLPEKPRHSMWLIWNPEAQNGNVSISRPLSRRYLSLEKRSKTHLLSHSMFYQWHGWSLRRWLPNL